VSIQTKCEGCGKSYVVKDELAGKRVQCPACKQAVQVPMPRGGETPATAREGSLNLWVWLAVCAAVAVLAVLATLVFSGSPDTQAMNESLESLAAKLDEVLARTKNLETKLAAAQSESENALREIAESQKELAVPQVENKGGPARSGLTENASEPMDEGRPPQEAVPTPEPASKLEPQPVRPAVPEAVSSSRLTISEPHLEVRDDKIVVTVSCAWTGEPNPTKYSTGTYRFQSVVTEFSVQRPDGNTFGGRVGGPDVQSGEVEYTPDFGRATFAVTPLLPLDSLPGLVGTITVQIGDSNPLTIDRSAVEGEEGPGKPVPDEEELGPLPGPGEALRPEDFEGMEGLGPPPVGPLPGRFPLEGRGDRREFAPRRRPTARGERQPLPGPGVEGGPASPVPPGSLEREPFE
jgi:hypothetical protein